MSPSSDIDGGRRRALIRALGGLAALAAGVPAAAAPDPEPGAGGDSLRLATIIAPGVDAPRRQVFVAMLEAAVARLNGAPGRPGSGARRWQLDVWELQGAPESWHAQLEGHYRQSPVFAVLSGLSDTTWTPVHDYCEATALPCWFPVVPLPDARPGDSYSVYFSRGVALEADVLASHVLAGGARPARLVQIHGDEAVGRGAAAALTRALAGSTLALESRAWVPGDLRALTRALRGLAAEDATMLWMARADLPLLAELPPPPAGAIYLSAQLAAGEKGLPVAWRRRARLVYPFELPTARAAHLEHLRAWLRARRLPLIDEVMQDQVLFAADSLADAVAGMRAAPSRDRLLPPAPPRRHASRGAYIVRYADVRNGTLVAESGWIVP